MTTTIKKQSTVNHQSWKALESHHEQISKLHLREIFAEDLECGERMATEPDVL